MTTTRPLFQTDFSAKTFPEWLMAESSSYRFAEGFLEIDKALTLETILPEGRRREIRVDLELMGEGALDFGFGDERIGVHLESAFCRIRSYFYGGVTFKSAPWAIPQNGKNLRVSIALGTDNLAVDIDGARAFESENPLGGFFSGRARLGFWSDCRITSISLYGEELTGMEVRKKIPKSEFFLEVAVDFFDDLIKGPFQEKSFDAMFAEFKRWGAKRCHWIYYGSDRQGLWRSCPLGVAENATKTMEEVGEIFDAAVRNAHKYDIELFGLLRMFDMAFDRTLPNDDKRGKLRRIGGKAFWMADFIAENERYCMRRHPATRAARVKKPITRIELIKKHNAPAAFAVGDIKIFVSDDNETYREYTGPASLGENETTYSERRQTPHGLRETGVRSEGRLYVFDALEITAPYVALSVSSTKRSFYNEPANILKVYDRDGEKDLITLGLSGRAKNAFKTRGVEFDFAPGTPNAVFPGLERMNELFCLDNNEGFLAFAEGANVSPPALSPAFPETRDWWLELIADTLDAGADGVELRARNHLSPLSWSVYNFEEPLVEEYKKRYSVDLLETENFDREKLRRLKGEMMTDFYRAANRLVSKRGKKLGLHVSQSMYMPPELGGAMDIHWDWRRWLDELNVDSVTLKEVWPSSPFGEAVMTEAENRRVKTVFSPFNSVWRGDANVGLLESRIKEALTYGCDGFQFYEGSALLSVAPDGNIVIDHPEAQEVFVKYFGARE